MQPEWLFFSRHAGFLSSFPAFWEPSRFSSPSCPRSLSFFFMWDRRFFFFAPSGKRSCSDDSRLCRQRRSHTFLFFFDRLPPFSLDPSDISNKTSYDPTSKLSPHGGFFFFFLPPFRARRRMGRIFFLSFFPPNMYMLWISLTSSSGRPGLLGLISFFRTRIRTDSDILFVRLFSAGSGIYQSTFLSCFVSIKLFILGYCLCPFHASSRFLCSDLLLFFARTMDSWCGLGESYIFSLFSFFYSAAKRAVFFFFPFS